MPSINRSTYMTPVQRFTQPGGYDMGPGGAVIEFDPSAGGLQRRRGHRPAYEDLVHQGCQPTGRRTGPPGYESEEYDCPFPIVGSPAWYQGKPKRETVFGDYDPVATLALTAITGVVIVGAVWWLLSKEAREFGVDEVRDYGEKVMERRRQRTSVAERRAQEIDPYEGWRGDYR